MKTIYKLFFLTVLICCLQLNAQQWQWAQSLGSINSNTKVNHLSKYQNNQFLISGSFASANLSLGNLTVSSSGQDDGFVALANINGTYSWLTKIGGTGVDKLIKAVCDASGNIYVAGNFASLSLTIGNTTLNNQGSTDAFLIRFNTDKSFAWARQIATSYKDEIGSLTVDNDGYVYVSGQITENTTTAEEIMFLKKFSANNTLLWEKNISTSGQILSTSLQTDNAQNIYIAGSLNGSANFGNNIILNANFSKQAFITKYNTSGTCLNGILNQNFQQINAMVIGANAIYSCGESPDYLMGWGWPLASSKVYVSKYNSNLIAQWEKTAGGLKPAQSFDIPTDIKIDGAENVYLCGYFFSDTLNFASQNHYNIFHINYFYPQIFVLKYNSNGVEMYAKTLGGILWDQANSILVYGEDKYIIGGNFESEQFSFGGYSVQNNSSLDSIYVHLKPKRFGRKTLGFLANFDVPSAIKDPVDEKQDVIYPNPAGNHFFISNNAIKNSDSKISIYNNEMCLINSKLIKKQDNDLKIDISELKQGIYFVSVENSKEKNFYKLIKR